MKRRNRQDKTTNQRRALKLDREAIPRLDPEAAKHVVGGSCKSTDIL